MGFKHDHVIFDRMQLLKIFLSMIGSENWKVKEKLAIFLGCFIAVYFLFYCLIASFNNENNSFFANDFGPLVAKAKRIAVGKF